MPAANGRLSSTYGLPRRLVAIPAPSLSATATTSSRAALAPWPTSSATLLPEDRTRAASARSSFAGITRGRRYSAAVFTTPCSALAFGAGAFCTSCGTMTTAGDLVAIALRKARSITIGTWSGLATIWWNWAATSANSVDRSISCM